VKLDDHVSALREIEAADDVVATATRLRVRKTLERGHGMRRHAGILAALIVMLVASASWALATGKLHRASVHAPSPLAIPMPVERPAPPPVVHVAPTTIPDLPVTVTPAPTRPDRYRIANDLYFHDRDYDKALAAFDEYLKVGGEFAVEARYNRALCLIHLGRLADAKLALAAFADGDVLSGYREDEAKKLIAKIDHRLNETP
jgi:hypothetical protein